MTRSGFRRLWILVLLVVLASSYFVYQKSTQKQAEIDSQLREMDRLVLERDSGRRLSAKLSELDQLTIDEASATRLDVLRYMGLEETQGYKFTETLRTSRRVDGVELFSRTFNITTRTDYKEALAFIDDLHNNEKITVNQVTITHVDDEYGYVVDTEIIGTIYGLDKKNVNI